MLSLFVAERVVGMLRGRYEPCPAWPISVAIGLTLAFLPWLHTRLALVALVLCAGYGYALYSHTPRVWPWRDPRWLAISAGLLLSLAVALAYNNVTLGGPLGASEFHGLRLVPAEVVTNFLCAHWDRLRGMFIQQPLLLVGLIGLVPFVLANRRAALFLGALYLAALLPPASNSTGGWAFFGRYNWAVVGLWTFPLAYALRGRGRKALWATAALCMAALALQVGLATRWLLTNNYLYHDLAPVWGRAGWYVSQRQPWLLARQPYFRDYTRTLQFHPANYVFTALGVVLIASGWLWQCGSKRALLAMWAALVPIAGAVLVCVPPELTSWRFGADQLPSNLGRMDGWVRWAEPADGGGQLVYGPYIRLPGGEYEVQLHYRSEGTAEPCVARWDIGCGFGQTQIAEGCLPASAGRDETFVTTFQVGPDLAAECPFEFRVWYLANTGLGLIDLEIRPLSLG